MGKRSGIIRAASYNIHKCVGTDGRRNAGRVIDVIANLGADVVALQEVDRRLGKRPTTLSRRVLEAHTDLEPIDIAHDSPSLGWHGNTILVRKGATIDELTRLEIPGLEPRGAILARINLNGKPLHVVATHLGLTRKMRRAQLAKIVAHLGTSFDIPTLIMGDFNEWSKKRGLEALSDFEVHAPGRSFHAARPLAALDRIALSKNTGVEDAGVVETKQSKVASDHLPIWADIAIG